MIDSAGEANSCAADIAQRLAAIRRTTAEVLLDAPAPLQALRLSAGDVCLELTWPAFAFAGTNASPLVPNGEVVNHSPTQAQSAPAQSDTLVRAPMVGVFYRAPQPGAAPFVNEGDDVSSGQQVAVIEAMKLMIPVETERAGRITAVLVEDGQPVEYGEPLYRMDTGS